MIRIVSLPLIGLAMTLVLAGCGQKQPESKPNVPVTTSQDQKGKKGKTVEATLDDANPNPRR